MFTGIVRRPICRRRCSDRRRRSFVRERRPTGVIRRPMARTAVPRFRRSRDTLPVRETSPTVRDKHGRSGLLSLYIHTPEHLPTGIGAVEREAYTYSSPRVLRNIPTRHDLPMDAIV